MLVYESYVIFFYLFKIIWIKDFFSFVIIWRFNGEILFNIFLEVEGSLYVFNFMVFKD